MNYYAYALAFHVMSILSWMAVMFYLPRLFVYHQEHAHKKEFVEVIELQEYNLYKYIGIPAFIASVLSGFLLIWLSPSLLQMPYMHLKLFTLVLLTIYSFSMEHYRVQLKNKTCTKSGQFFRAYNEVPTLLSTLIVSYVVVKEPLPYFSVCVILFFSYVIYKIATLKKKEPNISLESGV